jgi:hypothetical protein
MITIEEVKALYFDPDALIEPPYKLKRMDIAGKRWYYSIDENKIKFYGSVTTMIHDTLPTSPYLVKWMVENGENAEVIRDEKASYGTLMHIIISEYLLGKVDISFNSIANKCLYAGLNLNYAYELQKDVLAFAKFCEDYKVKPIGVEIGLKSDISMLAGTVDLVCWMNYGRDRITAIIDFKSGKKGFWESHEIQLHCYKDIWHENYPDVIIDNVFNWSPKDWRKEPTYTLKDQTDANSAQKLPYMINMFRIDNILIPKQKIVCNGEIGLGKAIEGTYKVQDMEDYIRENDEYFKCSITLDKGQYIEDEIF